MAVISCINSFHVRRDVVTKIFGNLDFANLIESIRFFIQFYVFITVLMYLVRGLNPQPLNPHAGAISDQTRDYCLKEQQNFLII